MAAAAPGEASLVKHPRQGLVGTLGRVQPDPRDQTVCGVGGGHLLQGHGVLSGPGAGLGRKELEGMGQGERPPAQG